MQSIEEQETNADRIVTLNSDLGNPIPIDYGNLGDRDNQYKESLSAYAREKYSTLLAVSSARKWWTAIIFAVLFAVLSTARWYEATTSLTEMLKLGPTFSCNGPTPIGIFIHSLIFFLIVRWLLN